MINSEKSYYVKIDNAQEIMKNNTLEIGKTVCAIKVKEVEKPVIENRGIYDCVTQNGDIATRVMVAHNEQLEKELKEQQAMIAKQKT